MKKIGIILVTVGIFIMGYAAYKFIEVKKQGSEEQVEKQNIPFPWLPTVGALLTAGGIIMIGSGKYRQIR